jgi:hypothetical protein
VTDPYGRILGFLDRAALRRKNKKQKRKGKRKDKRKKKEKEHISPSSSDRETSILLGTWLALSKGPHVRYLRVRRKYNIKMDLKEKERGIVDSTLIMGSYKHGSEPLDTTRGKELTDQLSYIQLLQGYYNHGSYLQLLGVT